METMGQKFKVAREKKKMTLSRAAGLTHIKVQNLEMLENDDFTKMPAPTYAKGFIRIYSGLLGLDSEPLIQEYIDLHLNAVKVKDERPAPRAKKTEPVSRGDEHKKTNQPSAPSIKELGRNLQEKFGAFVPHLPRVGMGLVAAFLLVGVVRCAVKLGSGRESKDTKPATLDSRAIMKEPPVRYLDLPAPEGQ